MCDMELNLPFPDSEPAVVEEEPSVIEYAREQGISVDYTTDLPRLVDVSLSLEDKPDQDLRGSFDDDLANAAVAAVELTKQRLTVTKDVALLLKSILALREPHADDVFATDGRQRILDMKQELPVLRTDAELDLINFGTRVEPDLRDMRTRIPSEDVDEENDEGFGWPAKYFTYPAQCDAKMKHEKLAVTREVLTLLQCAVRDDCTPEDEAKTIEAGLESRRDLFPRHLTPPLLPLSPPLTPYIPSSPANRLPLASQSSDSVMDEAKAVEQQVMAKDSLARHHSGSSDSMLLDIAELDALFDAEKATSCRSSDRTPAILKRRADDLKVEGPLTPPILSDSPMKKLKSVSFAKMIQIGDAMEPWSDEHRPGTSDTNSTTDKLFKEIGPLAEEVNRKVGNERLTGADTIARIEVPVVDFAPPTAPWNEYSQLGSGKHEHSVTELEAQMRFLQQIKRDDLKTATTWHGVSDLDLSWGWFASPVSTIKLCEKLHGELEFNKIHADLTTGSFATSSRELWKKDGLRILDEHDEDEDDEIEPAKTGEGNSMEGLIRKRKLELEEQEEVSETQRQQKQVPTRHKPLNPRTQTIRQELFGTQQWHNRPVVSPNPHKAFQTQPKPHPQQLKNSTSRHNRPANGVDQASTELMFGGFSASTALHKFMETQGKATKSARPATSSQNQKPPAATSKTLPVGSREPSAESSLSVGQDFCQITGVQGESRHQPAGSMPELPVDLPACSIIVSSTLLQRRALIKQVEKHHPQAELIYRDYTLPHCTSPEADIILSPSTSLVLTTLQQVKQLPLPGQVLRSPVKERMAVLQARYERLVVLISEGLREEFGYSRPEDARDKEILSGLRKFADQLPGDVQIQYIQGGEQTLARSIVQCIGNYSLPTGGNDMGELKLFTIETTWELFLRRSGLNPFAAQAILASLKAPTLVHLPPPPHSAIPYEPQRSVQAAGLPVFLLMGAEERAARFQALLGGRRILDGVGAVLDQRWLSAVDGFRMG